MRPAGEVRPTERGHKTEHSGPKMVPTEMNWSQRCFRLKPDTVGLEFAFHVCARPATSRSELGQFDSGDRIFSANCPRSCNAESEAQRSLRPSASRHRFHLDLDSLIRRKYGQYGDTCRLAFSTNYLATSDPIKRIGE